MRCFYLLIPLCSVLATSFDSAGTRLNIRSADLLAIGSLVGHDLERRSAVEGGALRNFKRGACLSKCANALRSPPASQRKRSSTQAALRAQVPSSREMETANSGSDRLNQLTVRPLPGVESTPRQSGVSGTSGTGGSSSISSESPQVVPDFHFTSPPESPVVYMRPHSPYLMNESPHL